MLSTSFIFLNYVCPSLGTILASATFSAPVTSLKKALLHQDLGDLNPTPWAFMTGNCLGWIAYSFITEDPFVLAANGPGFLISIWLNHGAAKLQFQSLCEISRQRLDSNIKVDGNSDDRLSDLPSSSRSVDGRTQPSLTSHEYWVLGILFMWTVILSAIVFFPMTTEQKQEVVGLCVNANLVVFYGAPLGTITMVLRLKHSSSIHRRTLAMTLFNTFFWSFYGIGVMDMWILVPNVCGLLLALFQLVLCCIFPKGDCCDEVAVEGNNRGVASLITEEDADDLQIGSTIACNSNL